MEHVYVDLSGSSRLEEEKPCEGGRRSEPVKYLDMEIVSNASAEGLDFKAESSESEVVEKSRQKAPPRRMEGQEVASKRPRKAKTAS